MPARKIRDIPTTDALAAIDAVAERRARVDDPARSQLPTAPRDEAVSAEPVEVALYVLAHTRVPRRVLCEDVLDCLLLTEFSRAKVAVLPGTLDKVEYRLLQLGITAGLSLTALGRPLGVRHRQTVEQRMLRYASGARGATRTPVNERAARASLRRQGAWAAAHGTEFLGLVDDLLARRDAMGVDAAATAMDVAYFRDRAGTPADVEFPVRLAALVTATWMLIDDLGAAAVNARLVELVADHRRRL